MGRSIPIWATLAREDDVVSDSGRCRVDGRPPGPASDPLQDARASGEGFVLPDRAVGDGDLTARFRRALRILDEVSDRFPEEDRRAACRRALAEIGVELFCGPSPLSPEQAAAAVCSFVGVPTGP